MKSDKELAVELASSYVSAWFSRETVQMKPMDGETIKSLIRESYEAIHALPDDGK